jgi:hypothetical protein
MIRIIITGIAVAISIGCGIFGLYRSSKGKEQSARIWLNAALAFGTIAVLSAFLIKP